MGMSFLRKKDIPVHIQIWPADSMWENICCIGSQSCKSFGRSTIVILTNQVARKHIFIHYYSELWDSIACTSIVYLDSWDNTYTYARSYICHLYTFVLSEYLNPFMCEFLDILNHIQQDFNTLKLLVSLATNITISSNLHWCGLGS